jgi:signal transduction histidine kinase/HAMP domain-containing protein
MRYWAGMRNWPLRSQLMLLFALLSIATTGITTVTLLTLASQRMNADLRDKSSQYARQLQRELESVVAFDDRLTARELFDSMMADRSVDGLAVYDSTGELLEGRGNHPAQLASLTADMGKSAGHAITVANIQSREGRTGRLYVSLSSQSIDELQRRDAAIAGAIATLIVLAALVLAVRASRPAVRRLVSIAGAAHLMASGDLRQTNLDDRAQDEIGALAHAFNIMVSELRRLHLEREQLVLTERERLENQVSERTQALQQSREMFRLIAESTKAVPFTLDLSRGYFPYIGDQAILSTGIAESQWKEPGGLDVAFPRDRNPELRQRLDECQAGSLEFEATTLLSNGARSELRWTGTCEWSTEAKLLRGLIQDITELRHLERELHAAQKLESVGRLAAGVAHEINTPVQFVSDNVQFIRTVIAEIAIVIEAYHALQDAANRGADVVAPARRAAEAEAAADLDFLMKDVPLAIDAAAEGLGRISTIVRSMKEFAHPDQAEKTWADLNQAIRSTLVVARNEYKYIAEIDSQFGELPFVPCYLGEINQVVLNLIINASHAISDVIKDTANRGTLTIRTRLDGDEVEISIADTGTGIPESARDKIFDPFFTTKEVGKGTGQGLAIARSVIVNKHGGTLRFETECGKGTTFFIRLPIDAPGMMQVGAVAA